ncbi:MAG: hypothetical protein IJC56_10275 [Clostridia bacterium]|nr:hypothetical protein [Clostridia bacterium]
MLIRIFLRGVLDIIDNDSPAIYAVLRENADESERSSYKSLVTAFYHLNDRLERLSWPV